MWGRSTLPESHRTFRDLAQDLSKGASCAVRSG
jgi:hypothetical protein